MTAHDRATHIMIDLETSGLDESRARVLEVAAQGFRFDVSGRLVEAGDLFHRLVRPPAASLATWLAGGETEDGVAEALALHRANGLLVELSTGAGLSLDAAAADLQAYLEGTCAGLGRFNGPILLGNSPEFDRRFLGAHMPRVAAALNWRQIDISTMRQIVAPALGLAGARLKDMSHALSRELAGLRAPTHRAVTDVKLSAGELAQYQIAVTNGAAVLAEVYRNAGVLA